MKKQRKSRKLFIVIGIVAIILAICCSSMTAGYWENGEVYGGDAYTGIQQAAAQTANNVQYLAEITRFGFSSILAIVGLLSIAYGIGDTRKTEEKLMSNLQNSNFLPNFNNMQNQQFNGQPMTNTSQYGYNNPQPGNPVATAPQPDVQPIANNTDENNIE